MKCYKIKCIVEAIDFSETSYGVLLVKDDNSREYYCNLSNNSESISELVSELNNKHIELCHIDSVIEDFRYNLSNT